MLFFVFLLLFFIFYAMIKIGVMVVIRRFTKQQNMHCDEISVVRKNIYGDFDTHWHEYYEMEYIIEGSGEYIIDGKKYDIKKGMLFFMSPINFHELKNSDAEIINVMFSGNMCDRSTLFSLFSGLSENVVYFKNAESDFVESLLTELISAVLSGDKIYYESILNCLMIKTGNAAKSILSSRLTYIQNAMLYILNNFRSGISLSDAAAHVGLTPAYLSSVFPKEAGVTFKDYLNSIRFDYAKKLLIYSDISVSEICYESGFDDYANFIRNFKKHFGMPPGQFRKNNQIMR